MPLVALGIELEVTSGKELLMKALEEALSRRRKR